MMSRTCCIFLSTVGLMLMYLFTSSKFSHVAFCCCLAGGEIPETTDFSIILVRRINLIACHSEIDRGYVRKYIHRATRGRCLKLLITESKKCSKTRPFRWLFWLSLGCTRVELNPTITNSTSAGEHSWKAAAAPCWSWLNSRSCCVFFPTRSKSAQELQHC